MPKQHLLLVEDEDTLAMILKDSLEAEGFLVTHSINGEDALKTYFRQTPDLIILDVMMPRLNGFAVAKTIRDTDRITPIIFLTAKSQTKDVIEGFEAGGNDYMRKPFSVEELVVRIKVMLNKQRLLDNVQENKQSIFSIGSYHFDSKHQTLEHKDEIRHLTARESELLKLLCQNQNTLLSKKSILLKIWGDDSFFNSRSMDVFISRLRKYLKHEPQIKIINVRGSGYKLVV